MTSKNSYWKLSKMNFKRRKPYLVLGFLLSFILMTVVSYFVCISFARDTFSNKNYVSTTLSAFIAYGSYMQVALTAILAVLFAITGNAWNNSQKKNDFYKALPIKEKTRFVYIHLNSYFAFVICFGINLLLVNAIIASFGMYDSKFVIAALYSFVIHSLEFGAVYFVTVIAQYLTGNSILAVCGTAVLCVVEPAVRLFLIYFRTELYRTYAYAIVDEFDVFMNNFTSPFAGVCTAYRSIVDKYQGFYLASNYSDIWPGVIKSVLQIAVYALIAYRIYCIRPAQAGNKNIVFDKTKPFIKALIMIPTTMIFVLIVITNGEPGIVSETVGLVVAVCILHIVLQFAIEGDFRSVKRGITSTAISGIIVAMVVVFFNVRGDKYDKYIPELAELESIGIFSGDDYRYDFYAQNRDSTYLKNYDYFLNEVKITDPEFIQKVLNEISNIIVTDTYYYDCDTSGDTIYSDITIAYNLKNGTRQFRSYVLPLENARIIELAKFDSQEYKKASNEMKYEGNRCYIDSAKSLKVEYHNYNFSDYDICAIEDVKLQQEMIDALAKDYELRKSQIYMNEIPVGSATVDAIAEEGTRIGWEMPVYRSDVNTWAVLKKAGYEYQELDRSLISKIEITKYGVNGNDGFVELCAGDEGFDDIAENVTIYTGYRNLEIDLSGRFRQYEVLIFDEKGKYSNGIFLPNIDMDMVERSLKK